jgi:hypothetical protein
MCCRAGVVTPCVVALPKFVTRKVGFIIAGVRLFRSSISPLNPQIHFDVRHMALLRSARSALFKAINISLLRSEESSRLSEESSRLSEER